MSAEIYNLDAVRDQRRDALFATHGIVLPAFVTVRDADGSNPRIVPWSEVKDLQVN